MYNSDMMFVIGILLVVIGYTMRKIPYTIEKIEYNIPKDGRDRLMISCWCPCDLTCVL